MSKVHCSASAGLAIAVWHGLFCFKIWSLGRDHKIVQALVWAVLKMKPCKPHSNEKIHYDQLNLFPSSDLSWSLLNICFEKGKLYCVLKINGGHWHILPNLPVSLALSFCLYTFLRPMTACWCLDISNKQTSSNKTPGRLLVTPPDPCTNDRVTVRHGSGVVFL